MQFVSHLQELWNMEDGRRLNRSRSSQMGKTIAVHDAMVLHDPSRSDWFFEAAGNIYLADTDFDHIRVIEFSIQILEEIRG